MPYTFQTPSVGLNTTQPKYPVYQFKVTIITYEINELDSLVKKDA